MNKASYKIKYNRRKSLLNDGTAPIEIEVCIDRKQKFINTGIKVLPAQWDIENKKIIKHSEKVRLNIFLNRKFDDIKKFESDLHYKGQYLTIDKLNTFLNKKSNTEFNFLTWIDTEIEKNTLLRETSKKQHRGMLEALKNHGQIKEFTDVNFEKIVAFDNWLRSDKETPRKQSTIHNYHKRLKVYVNKAIANDLIFVSPYIKFKVSKGKTTERRFLNAAELEAIEKKDIKIKRLDQVRDLFVFQCYTGLSYIDIAKLSLNDIISDEDNNRFIKTYRTKTEEKSTIFLLKKANQILQKYANGQQLLPIITNQHYNAYLKEIAVLCGIERNLTTHMARHTFATTVTLSKGVSIEVVSKALGHSDLATTQIYAKIVEERIADDMKKIDN